MAGEVGDPADRLERYLRRAIGHSLHNIRRIAVYHKEIDRLGEERPAHVLVRRAAHDQFVEGTDGRGPVSRPVSIPTKRLLGFSL